MTLRGVWALVGVLLAVVACGGSDENGPNGKGKSGAGGGAGSGASGGTGGVGGSGGVETTSCGKELRGSRCLSSGWCFDGPRPEGVDFKAIDGTDDASSAWAVGSLGGAFRYCSGRWVAIETGVETALYDVWHPSKDFAIAVGEQGTVIEWDGSSWKKLSSPTTKLLRSIWGTAKNDFYVGGDVDESGTLLFHFDGTKFERKPVPTTNPFRIHAITGRGPSDLHVVGAVGYDEDSEAAHFDGTSWTQFLALGDTGDFGPFTEALAYADGTTFGIVRGLHLSYLFGFNGTRWGDDPKGIVLSAHDRLRALSKDGSGHPIVVESTVYGESQSIDRFDGSAWQPTGDTLPAYPRAIWSAPGGGSWGVGDSTLLLARADTGAWTQSAGVDALPSKRFDELTGETAFLVGRSDTDLWLVTQGSLAHRDQAGWKQLDTLAEKPWNASVDLEGRPYVSTTSDLRYYESGWKVLPAGHKGPLALLAIAPNDVWVGESTRVAHFDGTSWNESYASGTCATSADRIRRAPDGTVWLLDQQELYAFDVKTSGCTRVALADTASFGNDRLTDLAFTPGGELWAITRAGKLYQRQNGVLVLRTTLVLKNAAGETFDAVQLIAMPSGKLRLVYDNGLSSIRPSSHVATIDPAAGSSLGTPLDAPGYGAVWINDDVHAIVATQGSVLRHGY